MKETEPANQPEEPAERVRQLLERMEDDYGYFCCDLIKNSKYVAYVGNVVDLDPLMPGDGQDEITDDILESIPHSKARKDTYEQAVLLAFMRWHTRQTASRLEKAKTSRKKPARSTKAKE